MSYHLAFVFNDIGTGELVDIKLDISLATPLTVLIKEVKLLTCEVQVVPKHAKLVKVPVRNI